MWTTCFPLKERFQGFFERVLQDVHSGIVSRFWDSGLSSRPNEESGGKAGLYDRTASGIDSVSGLQFGAGSLSWRTDAPLEMSAHRRQAGVC